MQSDSSQSGSFAKDSTHTCAWCGKAFLETTSLALAPDLFCARHCEIEARYWFFDQIQSAVLFRQSDGKADE